LIAVLAFVLTLGILIPVHEYAHYRVARAFGVKAERFSIGFGRVLWRRQPRPDGTEFVLSAVPLGGYVRWIDDRESPPIAPHERSQMFAAHPLWQRATIVAAGPLSNLLLAVLLFAAAFWVGIDEPKAIIGQPTVGSLADAAGLRAGDLVLATGTPEAGAAEPDWTPVRAIDDLQSAVVDAALDHRRLYLRVRAPDEQGAHETVVELDRLPPHFDEDKLAGAIGLDGVYTPAVLGAVKPGGPAAAAGLREGDRVLAIAGRPVADAKALLQVIRADVQHGRAEAQPWRIERDGYVLDLVVQPRVDEERGQQIGRIDAYVGAQPAMTTVRYGLVDGLAQGARRTMQTVRLTLRMLGQMVVGRASTDNLSGPVTIGQAAGQALRSGPAVYLGFLGWVSVSLGVLNFLPLPVLDGGHLMYYIFEAVTGRPVAGAWLRWLQGVGFVLILLLMSLALHNDMARLTGLH
jgi:regulator of sigma E protease